MYVFIGDLAQQAGPKAKEEKKGKKR